MISYCSILSDEWWTWFHCFLGLSWNKTGCSYAVLLLLETAYTYEWSLISHPADYSGEMEHRHSQTLKLSHVSEL